VAAPASAIDLDAAKRQGLVGEQPDGYLGTVRQTPEAAELVRSVNQQRRQSYQDLAKRNGVSVDSVATLAGRKLIDRAAPAEYVKDASAGGAALDPPIGHTYARGATHDVRAISVQAGFGAVLLSPLRWSAAGPVAVRFSTSSRSSGELEPEQPTAPCGCCSTRGGRWRAGNATFVVYYFGAGQGGSNAANIERWQSQFTTADGGPVEPVITTSKAGDVPVTLVELRGSYARSLRMGRASMRSRTRPCWPPS